MKILDFVHNFNDGNTQISRGLCRVRSFVGESGTTVLLTDLGNLNDGQSVTNAVELIITSLFERGFVIPPAIFIEHYERSEFEPDTFDIVSISPKTEWNSISRKKVLNLIGGCESELNERSTENSRILAQSEKFLFRREPFRSSNFSESNDVIKRRLEIIDGMISKSSIEAVIKSGSNEQEIQRLLKNDLSIFGEAYAKPDDEYICFSEFPLVDGAIDFVVFTGRSRMDIILIEVKGAEFNLVNSNHYQAFNHKITQAAGQIENRLGIIFRDLNLFRKNAHELRCRVENGEIVHNSFQGPYGKLQVDPKKDINIRSVIIGGRTQNDLKESLKRQDYEARTTPPIRVESWDTWLRRLQRI